MIWAPLSCQGVQIGVCQVSTATWARPLHSPMLAFVQSGTFPAHLRHGCVPQGGAALKGCAAQGGGFPLFPVSVMGGGIKTAVHNIFKNFWEPLCFPWVSGQVDAAYEGWSLSACQEAKGLSWCHTGWIWIALVRKSSCGYLGDEYKPFWLLTSEF